MISQVLTPYHLGSFSLSRHSWTKEGLGLWLEKPVAGRQVYNGSFQRVIQMGPVNRIPQQALLRHCWFGCFFICLLVCLFVFQHSFVEFLQSAKHCGFKFIPQTGSGTLVDSWGRWMRSWLHAWFILLVRGSRPFWEGNPETLGVRTVVLLTLTAIIAWGRHELQKFTPVHCTPPTWSQILLMPTHSSFDSLPI